MVRNLLARNVLLRRGVVAFAVLMVSGMGHPVLRRATPLLAFPRVTLWAWETPEDLRTLDPHRYAVAYLDQTIFISHEVSSRPRLQPLLIPTGTKVMAVVRIEASAQGADISAPDLPETVAALIQHSAERPGVSALQIDFDATRSQRTFYTNLIRRVRGTLPKGMPLSITALASWCAADDWISGLPVDEAVPMFFRMGRDARPSNQPGWSYPIREQLCTASLGVSTDEPWPAVQSDQRLYVFHPRAWNPIALENIDALVKP